jgi:hypothetical protein
LPVLVAFAAAVLGSVIASCKSILASEHPESIHNMHKAQEMAAAFARGHVQDLADPGKARLMSRDATVMLTAIKAVSPVVALGLPVGAYF